MLSYLPYTSAENHSIACPNGNPAFDIDCKASHAGTHGCRNSCKVSCSMGNKKKVLLLKLSNRNVQNMQLKNVMNYRILDIWLLDTISSPLSLNSKIVLLFWFILEHTITHVPWHHYLQGDDLWGWVEIFDSELFICESGRGHCPGNLSWIFWSQYYSDDHFYEIWYLSKMKIMTFQVDIQCEDLKKKSTAKPLNKSSQTKISALLIFIFCCFVTL